MIGGIPLTALPDMVFSPSGQVGSSFFWICAAIAWTIVTIPYSAWGAELSLDYRGAHDHRLAQEMLGIIGQLLVMGCRPSVDGLRFTASKPRGHATRWDAAACRGDPWSCVSSRACCGFRKCACRPRTPTGSPACA